MNILKRLEKIGPDSDDEDYDAASVVATIAVSASTIDVINQSVNDYGNNNNNNNSTATSSLFARGSSASSSVHSEPALTLGALRSVATYRYRMKFSCLFKIVIAEYFRSFLNSMFRLFV